VVILREALDATLPEMQAEAEGLMVEEFEIGDYAGGYAYDEVTGTTSRTFAADFTSKGRLLTNTVPAESQVGERTVVAISRTLHLPVSSPAVASGKTARRTTDGAAFRVLADVSHGSHPKSRRLAVEELVS
jgi:hypothetical protein